ncbi:PREDICTED: DNA repair-scaffolding protein-like, partial [Tinamus guttatus]|uniref:DNA repair-scaffolding protein-like n=1 Tax=Tinamus guttatus TaxID=94827 RepID=UPI00052E9A59
MEENVAALSGAALSQQIKVLSRFGSYLQERTSGGEQKLLLRNTNVPVIMNTYFSQKVLRGECVEGKEKTHGSAKQLIRKNIVSLAHAFRLNDPDDRPQESSENQVARAAGSTQTSTKCGSKEQPSALSAVNDSLLEMVESQGAAGWRDVQRSYFICRINTRVATDKHFFLVSLNYQKYGEEQGVRKEVEKRLCLLVQDAYGMFSEVQLQFLDSAEDVGQYCRRWEGRFCCLAGMKVVQRATRARTLGLFSLIDSLWPPVVPVKVPGQSQDSEMMTTSLPPPSFCYILAVHSGEILMKVDEEEEISNLYQPPVVHGLKEIFQIDRCNVCCSFWARVLYLRLQTKHNVPVNQREIWLFVTDCTLQNVVPAAPSVVAVSVAASCVLSTEVVEALAVTSRVVFFRDALWAK